MRIGLGYDIHAFCENRDLWLAGVKIPFTKGLLGHSDADVILHALCDALLGAAALGDIGTFFPDTDPRYKDISSAILLQDVMEKVKLRGFTIVNIDIVVICEEPKIGPYRDKMQKTIADLLRLEKQQVNIKAATNEKMGDIGQGKAIAAQAVCLLN